MTRPAATSATKCSILYWTSLATEEVTTSRIASGRSELIVWIASRRNRSRARTSAAAKTARPEFVTVEAMNTSSTIACRRPVSSILNSTPMPALAIAAAMCLDGALPSWSLEKSVGGRVRVLASVRASGAALQTRHDPGPGHVADGVAASDRFQPPRRRGRGIAPVALRSRQAPHHKTRGRAVTVQFPLQSRIPDHTEALALPERRRVVHGDEREVR